MHDGWRTLRPAGTWARGDRQKDTTETEHVRPSEEGRVRLTNHNIRRSYVSCRTGGSQTHKPREDVCTENAEETLSLYRADSWWSSPARSQFSNLLEAMAVFSNAQLSRKHGFTPWVGKILWRKKWQPAPVFVHGKSYRQRRPVGCSPRGHKGSDATEYTHTHTQTELPHLCFSLGYYNKTP